MIQFIKNQICYSSVRKLLSMNKAVKFMGPYGWTDGRTQVEILEFLKKENSKKAPYLNSKETRDEENRYQINQRSAHFVARSQGKIIAYVRLTPRRFELDNLSGHFKSLTRSFNRYWEISRLNTDSELSNKSYIAGLLMLKAGLWLFSTNKGQGLVGICHPRKVGFFTRFGLESLSTDFIAARMGRYHLVAASKIDIINNVMNNLFFSSKSIKGALNVRGTIKRKA